MKILIAEDDPVSRRLLQALLQKWGYEVTVASDGEEAWELLQQEGAPRLAIIDWMMPKMDGAEVCRKVRATEGGAYVYLLLLTAKTQKEDIVRGIGAGADDYVTKPFDANELNARLRAARRILDLQADLVSARESLRMQATHDYLTGLPNRLLFSDRLTQRLAQCRRSKQSLAVLYLDLDRFKLINDTFGHSFGDRVLNSVATRLTSCLREIDTLARMGGDEFTILLNEVDTPDGASETARRILETLCAPFSIDDRELFVTASIGISMFPHSGRDVETLVQNADSAMYQAKKQGKNSCHLFAESPRASSLATMTVETSLRKAIERNELVVYYQPLVDMKSSQVMGSEALIRWQHPEHGLLPPGHFIPVAEETGLICPISDLVVETACMQNKAWQQAGYDPLTVAVNVSARQFHQDTLVHSVTKALQKSHLDPWYLELELTESIMMQDSDATIKVLKRLKDMGIRISIDDFGTGYSSLSYLKRFPIDSVKIDRSFIQDITANSDDAAIAAAVIAMAHSLKLTVIAEGVETLEQLQLLQSLQCDEMQGYFVSPAVPADDFIEIVRRNQFGRPDIRFAA